MLTTQCGGSNLRGKAGALALAESKVGLTILEYHFKSPASGIYPPCLEDLRRVQRFLARYALNLDLIAKVIFALLPVQTGLVLSLNRTYWKFGEVNILMLGVTFKGVAFPLLFTMLDKRGNSNWKEQIWLIDSFRAMRHALWTFNLFYVTKLQKFSNITGYEKRLRLF